MNNDNVAKPLLLQHGGRFFWLSTLPCFLVVLVRCKGCFPRRIASEAVEDWPSVCTLSIYHSLGRGCQRCESL